MIKNPECAVHLLMLNLETPNAGDAYPCQTDYLDSNVNILEVDKAIFCKDCGSLLKKDTPAINLLGGVCPLCVDSDLKSVLESLSIKDKGYYVKLKTDKKYTYAYRRPTDKMSSYYEAIKACDVFEMTKDFPKVDKDIVVLGLGSAGSSIIEQLGRTNLVDTYILVDFDVVERKNLRNQFYTDREIGYSKAYASKKMLEGMNRLNIKEYTNKFQDVNFSFIKSKYTVLGFDTIRTRLQAFEEVKSKKIESKYLIDVRYNDLEASIYFIDMEDENQVNYYYNTLQGDLENLNTTEVKEPVIYISPQTIAEKFEEFGGVNSNCRRLRSFYEIRDISCHFGCGTSGCYEALAQKANLVISEKSYLRPENSCVKQNIVDIYKFASSFITSTIREIEAGNEKLFTHVEVTTKPFPAILKIR